MSTVVFNADEFRIVFSAFADEVRFPDAVLQNAWNVAVTMIGAGDDSVLPYCPDCTPPNLTRKTALDYLTCHILTMQYLWQVDQTGAVTSATQGSVSVSFGVPTAGDSVADWYNKTKCGATAWQILQAYANGPLYYGVTHIYTGG